MTHPLTLGDEAMDDDHVRLESLIEELLTAPTARMADVLDALRVHARTHFDAEDEDIRAIGDGNSQCHLDEHVAVLKSLDEVHAILAADAMAEPDKATLARRLGLQLRSWLPEHVREMDTSVATFRLKRRFGGAPVRIMRREAG